MFGQFGLSEETLTAVGTDRIPTDMSPFVPEEQRLVGEALPTENARVRLVQGVEALVPGELVLVDKALAAVGAGERHCFLVDPLVAEQVLLAGVRFATG